MIGRDFVTVTKSESGDWEAVHKTASEVIESHLNANETVLFEEKDAAQTEGANEVEQKIIDLLEKEIRPAVAMDGGDITFDRFDEGIVYLFLQGSCAGCPSATMTLQQGIEVRLKELIPEVKQVVSTN